MQNTKTQRPLASLMKARILDYTLYVLIGLTIGGVAWFGGMHAAHDEHLDLRWIALMCVTPITFGYPVKSFQRYWNRWRFWCAFAFLLLTHLSIYSLVLWRIEHFVLIWFPIVNVLEWTVIYPVLDWSGRYHGDW